MTDVTNTFRIAASGMRAQAVRLRHVSENIANADTPGYRRKTVSFESNRTDQGHVVDVGPMRFDRSPLERLYEPGHPLADADGYYDGSNVSLIIEIADAREAQRSYDANLKIFDQARQMTQSALELLRR